MGLRVSGTPFSRVRLEVSCWSDQQNDDRHLGGAWGMGPHATTRDCRRVRIRRRKFEFETFRTLTHQGTSWYEALSSTSFYRQNLKKFFCLKYVFFFGFFFRFYGVQNLKIFLISNNYFVKVVNGNYGTI